MITILGAIFFNKKIPVMVLGGYLGAGKQRFCRTRMVF